MQFSLLTYPWAVTPDGISKFNGRKQSVGANHLLVDSLGQHTAHPTDWTPLLVTDGRNLFDHTGPVVPTGRVAPLKTVPGSSWAISISGLPPIDAAGNLTAASWGMTAVPINPTLWKFVPTNPRFHVPSVVPPPPAILPQETITAAIATANFLASAPYTQYGAVGQDNGKTLFIDPVTHDAMQLGHAGGFISFIRGGWIIDLDPYHTLTSQLSTVGEQWYYANGAIWPATSAGTPPLKSYYALNPQEIPKLTKGK